MRRRFPAVSRILPVAALAMVLLAGCRPIESLDPATPQGLTISNLFNFTFLLSIPVLALVIGLLVYNIVRFRERPGDGEPPQIHGNTRLEIAWTVGPIILITILSVMSCQTMFAVEEPQGSPLVVRVIGHQWWWEYRYPDLGIVTANELHVPVGVPVRLDIEAADVLHSFWVPQIGWKMDAINNKTNIIQLRAERTGIYEGACTEFCGPQHAWMRIRVFAEPRDRFDAWASAQVRPAATASNASRGLTLFTQNTCINCHAVNGTVASAQVGPDLSHFGSRTTLGAGVMENTPENLGRWINDVQEVKPGALMPSYNFSDADLRALVEYLEGLK